MPASAHRPKGIPLPNQQYDSSYELMERSSDGGVTWKGVFVQRDSMTHRFVSESPNGVYRSIHTGSLTRRPLDREVNTAGRTPEQELMVRFAYYAGLAAAQFPEGLAALLVEYDYEDPREVLKELSEWCVAHGESL